MGMRYYNSTLGRFLSVDPLVQNHNVVDNIYAYSYAGNNPVNFRDDSGLFKIQLHTEDLGHVGIQVKHRGKKVNYDYGRYKGKYKDAMIYSGPNVLKKSIGNMPYFRNMEGFIQYEFKVSKRLESIIAREFAAKFKSGARHFPPSVRKRMPKRSRTLRANQRYMGSDWSPTNPNCTSFIIETLTSSLAKVIEDKKYSKKLKDEARAVLSVVNTIDDNWITTTPSDVADALEDWSFGGEEKAKYQPYAEVPLER